MLPLQASVFTLSRPTALAPTSPAAGSLINATSLAFAPGCSDGESRKYHTKTTAQTRPRPPQIRNVCCQPSHRISGAASMALIAPSRVEETTIPWAVPRPWTGNHLRIAGTVSGKTPAWAKPNANRTRHNASSEPTTGVSPVSTLHITTMPGRMNRKPTRSPRRPIGICIIE